MAVAPICVNLSLEDRVHGTLREPRKYNLPFLERTFRLKSRYTTTRCPPAWTKNRLASMDIQLFAEISDRRDLSQPAKADLASSSTSTSVEGEEMGQFNSRGSIKLPHIYESRASHKPFNSDQTSNSLPGFKKSAENGKRCIYFLNDFLNNHILFSTNSFLLRRMDKRDVMQEFQYVQK